MCDGVITNYSLLLITHLDVCVHCSCNDDLLKGVENVLVFLIDVSFLSDFLGISSYV